LSFIVNTSIQTLEYANKIYPCRIGIKGAVPSDKGQEGDQKTPLGDYYLRFGLYRADRVPRPQSQLNFRPIRKNDGWCDAPNAPAYNRFIRLPYPASHETLWREDGAYDIILVISHNDHPPQSGLGSAVFIHIAQPDGRKTLGCVAIDPEVMVKILPKLHMGMAVNII